MTSSFTSFPCSKKKHFLSIILIFLSSLIFAKTDFSFYLTPHLGLTFAQVDEILYDRQGLQCSLLEWEQMPLFDMGLTADFEIKDFQISSGLEYSFLAGPSKMTDTDWDDGEKYSVTVHPLISSQKIDADLLLAYKIRLPGPYQFCLSPTLEVEYQYIDFDADKGNGVRNERKIKVYGVDLTRHSFFVFTGIKAGIDLASSFNLAADFLFAPYCYQYEVDFHKGVKHPFTSIEIQNGYLSKFKTGITAGIKVSDKLSINLFSQLLFGSRDKGDFYSNYYTEEITKFEDQQSGTNIFAVKCGISSRIKI